MTATPEGPEWGNLPWCPLDPEHGDELARKAYVDAVAAGVTIVNIPGLREKLDDIKNKFNSVAAALAGKMPIAPTDGKKYAGAGSGWVEAIEPPKSYELKIPAAVPIGGLLTIVVNFNRTFFDPNYRIHFKINGVEHEVPVWMIFDEPHWGVNGVMFYGYSYHLDNVPVNAGDFIEVPYVIPSDAGSYTGTNIVCYIDY